MPWLVPWPVLLAGCGDGRGTDLVAPSTLGPATGCPQEPAEVSLRWEPCEDDECADAVLPLDPCDPDGGEVGIAVARHRFAGTAEGDIWYLMGGPGGSGTAALPSLVAALGDLPFDLYTLDHRGVGASTALRCPAQEDEGSEEGARLAPSELSGCAAHLEGRFGQDLQHFSTTGAAWDLAALLAATERPHGKTFVYGGSYGTYWAIRHLQLFPEQADGVILEGIAGPGFSFHDFHFGHDEALRKIMGRCAEDAACADRWSPDPWADAQAILAAVREGACPGIAFEQAASVLVSMSYYGPANGLVPAIVHRLGRCETRDQVALVHAYDLWFGPGGLWSTVSLSYPTFVHVGASELWDPGADPEEIAQGLATCTACTGTAGFLASARAVWPLYDPGPLDDLAPEPAVPLLMLQGELDPASPIEKNRWMEEVWNARDQAYAAFPQAGHAVLGATPTTGGFDCGLALFAAFVDEPRRRLDLSCVEETLPMDFLGEGGLAGFYLGTDDAWGG